MEEQDKLKILKELLLTEEKEFADTIAEKVEELSKIVHQKQELSHKVDPIIDDKLDEFIEEIPKTLGPTITEALKEEIKNSQDAVVEALFPIIGKMIKKYIAHEMKLLSENISHRTKKAFSFKNWFKRTKARAQGITDGDLAIAEYAKPRLIQMFVIEKNSGILITDYSPLSDGTIDKEMVAGMLTAIKSFVEDAFKAGSQDLQTIEYELYTIHIQNFYSYYIAAVISGAYTMMFKEVLEDQIIDFAKNHISKRDLENNILFTQKLKNILQMTLSKKVVILGPFGVGKTSLFRRFIDNEFSEDYKVTLGVQIKKKAIVLPDERELSMILWDTEGHSESVQDTRKSYLLGSHAFIYVFDLTREETYKNLNQDLEYLQKHYGKVTIKILGNKSDLVNEKEIKTSLTDQNIPFNSLTSAKTNKNVENFFSELAKEITK